MSKTHRPTLRGFSILELLIALIIIGILTTVLVPTLTRRVELARIHAVEEDLDTIAQAQDRTATDTGYFLRLFALNDLARGDGALGGDTNAVGIPGGLDGVADERTYNTFFNTAVNSIFILPVGRANLSVLPTYPTVVSAVNATAIFDGILRVDPNRNINTDDNDSDTSQGPYYLIRNDQTANNATVPYVPLHLYGIPNDPWGNDYILFFRNGALIEPTGTIIATLTINGTSYKADAIFDRPTILSLGPDGMPGANGIGDFGTGDDVYRQFGF